MINLYKSLEETTSFAEAYRLRLIMTESQDGEHLFLKSILTERIEAALKAMNELYSTLSITGIGDALNLPKEQTYFIIEDGLLSRCYNCYSPSAEEADDKPEDFPI